MKTHNICVTLSTLVGDPLVSRSWVVEGVDVDAVASRLDDLLTPFRRAKRVVVWLVEPEYREKYLKPGQEPVKRGEIFPDGWALSKRLGKNSNVVAQAIYTAKRVGEDPTRDFFGQVCGLKVCYVSDLDARDGEGAVERFSQMCEDRRLEDPNWG